MSYFRHHDWEAIQQYYDEVRSARKVAEHFGVSTKTLSKASKEGKLKLLNYSEAMKFAVKSGKHQQKWSRAARAKMRELAIQRGLGGNRNSHRVEYKGLMFDSTYELRVAKVLDREKIEWIQPKTRFIWQDSSGKIHRYRPDFFLTERGIYLDPKHKGLIELHRDKIEAVQKQNGITVRIIDIDLIQRWEKYGVTGL
jgi:predicted DNA-binding protein YlxM (UPF0122 family)